MRKISIIIPVLNEAEGIETILLPLLEDSTVEIIVVDGGSEDRTCAIVRSLGVTNIIHSPTGRADQMNAGQQSPPGNLTVPPCGYPSTEAYKEGIYKALGDPEVIAGAFELAIDGTGQSLRWVEKMANLRSHWLALPYGDQAIFLKKSIFEELGGFTKMPIMEDYELIGRLKQKGKIAIVPQSVLTSRRRWEKLGIWPTTLINQLIILGYYLGVSPHRLARWYGRK